MHVRYFSFLIPFFLYLPLLPAQNIPCGRVFKIQEPVSLEYDPLGQALIFNEQEILKISSGDTIFNRFSQLSWGPIRLVDATNPMKILVFYKEAARLVFLDNTLSPNGDPLDLIALGYDQTELACTSFDNGLWLYDRLNFRLVRLNASLAPSVVVPNLNQVLSSDLQFCRLAERNNRLYLFSTKGEVFVFDVYGSFLFQSHCPAGCQCQVADNYFRFTKDGAWMEIPIRNASTMPRTLAQSPEEGLVYWLSAKKALFRSEEGQFKVCRVQ